MPQFGDRSKRELATCHPHLRLVLDEAIERVDFTVLEGYRGEEKQNEAYRKGASTLRYPESKHNNVATEDDVSAGFAPTAGAPLSLAVDIAPWYPDNPHVRWDGRAEFYILAGLVRGIGEMILPEGWAIRTGADWDRDGKTHDQSFHDLPHIELIEVPA